MRKRFVSLAAALVMAAASFGSAFAASEQAPQNLGRYDSSQVIETSGNDSTKEDVKKSAGSEGTTAQSKKTAVTTAISEKQTKVETAVKTEEKKEDKSTKTAATAKGVTKATEKKAETTVDKTAEPEPKAENKRDALGGSTKETAKAIKMNTRYNDVVDIKYKDNYGRYGENWYTFTLNSPGYINITLFNNKISDMDYRAWEYTLYNSNLEQIDWMVLTTKMTTLSYDNIGLDKGRYYMKIRGNWSAENREYGFMYKYVASNYWERELNDDFSRANTIQLRNEYYGGFRDDGESDFYKVYIPNSGYVNVGIKFKYKHHPYQTLYVYNGNRKQTNKYEFDTKTTVSHNTGSIYLTSGWHYLRFVGGAANNQYQGYSFRVNVPLGKVGGVSTYQPSGGGIGIKWNKVLGASHYELWRGTSLSGSFTKIATISGTSRVDSSVSPGRTYYYKVRARNGNSYGGYSLVVSRRVSLQAPKVTIINRNAYSLRIQWNTVAGASQYEVWRATSPSGKYTKIATMKGTNYRIDGGLSPARPYYYKIRARYGNVYSAFSAYKGGRTLPVTQSPITVVKRNSSSASIRWTKAAGATGYEIYRSTSYNGKYSRIGSTSGTSFGNGGLTRGRVYYYKVRAYTIYGGVRYYGRYSAAKGIRM